MKSQIVQHAKAYVTELLQEGLSPDHVYHSLSHTMSVRNAGKELGKRYQLDDEQMELLSLAALFHDTGFTRTYNGHEDVSKEIAGEFLKKENYPDEKIQKVKDLIEVTKVGVEPNTMLEKIIKDSDFNTYDGTYFERSEALRREWEIFCNVKMTDEDWNRNSYNFWENHRFYTGEAQALYGEEKRKTLKKLRKEFENKDEQALKKPDPNEQLRVSISNSKSAQMMFKTTLRNQIDLTNIADNKANIMLSINSLLITFGMPLLATQIERHPNLVWPGTLLLLTCILTIVYATLATRPVKMHGHTDLSNIRSGKTNLFFFGNFFKMTRDDYIKGLAQVTKSENILDASIVNDLYFLGRALGQKYYRLRITYSIFMVGMVITVLVFAITFLIGK